MGAGEGGEEGGGDGKNASTCSSRHARRGNAMRLAGAEQSERIQQRAPRAARNATQYQANPSLFCAATTRKSATPRPKTGPPAHPKAHTPGVQRPVRGHGKRVFLRLAVHEEAEDTRVHVQLAGEHHARMHPAVYGHRRRPASQSHLQEGPQGFTRSQRAVGAHHSQPNCRKRLVATASRQQQQCTAR
jgi:hypothetical protein